MPATEEALMFVLAAILTVPVAVVVLLAVAAWLAGLAVLLGIQVPAFWPLP